MNTPRVLMLHAEHTSVGYLRIIQPAQALERKGWQVTYFPDALPHESIKSKGYDPIIDWYDKHAKDFDLVVAARTSVLDSVSFLCKMRKYNNKPLVMEFDDHFANVPVYNSAYQFHHASGSARKVALMQLKLSDAATVSTEPLVKYYRKFNDRIELLPNCVDPRRWEKLRVDPERAKDKSIRIVLASNSGRYGDAEVLRKPLTEIMVKYPNVKLFFLIMYPDWAADWNRDTYNPRNNRAYFVTYTPFRDWPRILKWGGFDIALNPLANNEFNECKSNCKFLDYAMTGISGIYSPIKPYEDVVDGLTGLTANTENEWFLAIECLINSEDQRRHLAFEAKQYVMDHYDIDNRIHLWESAYERFAALEANVECQPSAYPQAEADKHQLVMAQNS